MAIDIAARSVPGGARRRTRAVRLSTSDRVAILVMVGVPTLVVGGSEELAAIGRPSILVPLPHALDQDQLANANVLAAVGGAMVLKQDDFTPARLAADQPSRTAKNTRGRANLLEPSRERS